MDKLLEAYLRRGREIIGDRPDVRIVGDRFVFQSEVLFAPGNADLADEVAAEIGERRLRGERYRPILPRGVGDGLRAERQAGPERRHRRHE